ncbi:MAG: hypothetical protein GXX96_19775 [Planctomycetaceae bacterium]|nr:hypothetical protein [Planctomycetaceae bacterium]
MKQSSALLLSSTFSLAAAVLVAAAACLLAGQLGDWRWLFYLGALLSALGASYPFRQATWGSRRWIRALLRRHILPGEAAEQSQALPALPHELASILEERLEQVERRERKLADRLASYHQWFEFPPPLDVAAVELSAPERLLKDRQLDQLLDEKTQVLYEKIRKNEYSPKGRFEFTLVRDDVYMLVGAIAKLYGDDPERPLAGVSSERVLRAAGRCCMKFLVELEKLPLDIHTYDIVDVYGYIRQAVNVYGLYRSARRYMPWLRGAYYGTWVAMGANPLALGAWWFVSSLGTKGASTVATNIANRWALSFLHDIVRVVGYEVAGVYDPNLRYRDPNWCFAAELTELLQSFAGSETSLRRALSLVGALQLRNEYDRIFFFRCIVEGKRAGMKRMPAAALPVEQRREIAERLETFLKSYIADPNPKAVGRWRAGVEDRLDIALAPHPSTTVRPLREQRQSAIRSLAGYLLEIKQAEVETLRPLLEKTPLVASVPAEEQGSLWQNLADDPPYFFEAPDIVPGTPLVLEFTKDLVDLAVRVAPRYPVADELVLSTVVRLRGDARAVKRRLDARYVSELAGLLPDDAPRRHLPPDVARAVLDLLQGEDELHFVYGDVEPVAPGHIEPARVDRARTWLVGVGRRLVAFTMRDGPELLWEGDRQVALELVKGRVRGACRIRGGRWVDPATDSTPTLLVRGRMLGGGKRYFAALKAFVLRATT